MQILLYKFYCLQILLCKHTSSIMQISLCKIPLFGFQYENSIVCKFYCVSSYMQILLCGFQYTNFIVCKFYHMQISFNANSFVQIPSYTNFFVQTCKFHLVIFIVQILLYINSIMQSYKFHHANSIMQI